MKITNCVPDTIRLSHQNRIAMKLIAVFLLAALFQTRATTVAQITYKATNTKLETIFTAIKNQTGYSFFYNKADLSNAKPVSVNFKNVSLQDALINCLKNEPLTYFIEGKTIVISAKPIPDITDPPAVVTAPLIIDIRGKVTNDKGEPLAGATILVKGTSLGTSTDVNGEFQIDVPDNSSKILVFSFIGMEQQEVNVAGKTIINVALHNKVIQQQEVVLVGYGEANKANLTTAQTTITSKQMDETINTTIEQAIQGRTAGVYVTQNSGQPGGGISVNIRGVSTISGSTEPLYVIDGVQIQGESVAGAQSSSNPLAGLDPSDVEDIQVLQGPSATAIYGSRATNGVLLITTKRGKAGVTKLNYSFQYNIQTPPRHLDVMNLQQYAQMVKDFQTILGSTTPERFLDPTLLGAGTDWQKELFKNAPMSKHQLSMSGGNEKTTYYMSGEYLDQDGVAAGSGFDRYGFRLNLDNKPRDWISLGANLSFNQTKENLTTSDNGIIYNALRLTPQIPVKNFDGTWGGGDVINGANQYAPVNPIAIANLVTNKNLRREFIGGLNASINITKGLAFRTSFNTRINYRNSTLYTPTYAIGYAINTLATFSDVSALSAYWNWNQLLEYNKKIRKHSFDVMVTHEVQASNYKNVGGTRSGYLTNDVFDLNAGDPVTASNVGGSGQWAMESFLGRLNYNYDNRYILSGTLRRDGSVNFGPGNKWGNFPSLSVAWRLSQEKFFNVPFISELKFRYETGLTGNQGSSGGIYSPLNTYPTPFGGTGFLPRSYSNPGLKWEETKTNNYGLNIGVLHNKIKLEADYYIKNTDNLLMSNPLPWYMGTVGTGAVNPPIVNLGGIQNKGWSVTINTVNISNKNFKWESNLNLSSFKTTVTYFYSDNAFVDRVWTLMTNWTQRSAVGKAPWLFRGYIEEGLFTSIDEINNSAVPVDNTGKRLPTDSVKGVWVGDVKFKDVSGPNGKPDGIIDTYDQTYIGNPWPKMFGGFSNTFSYKNFDLNILITATFGNDVYNYLAFVNSDPKNITLSRNLSLHTAQFARTTFDKEGNPVLENPETDVPRLYYQGPNGNNLRLTDKWVEDGSYVRLKNVSLSYNLPSSLLSKQSFLKGVKATVGVQNAITITGYSGFDPEVGSYIGNGVSSGQAIGVDFGHYPLTPIYSFSLNVNF